VLDGAFVPAGHRSSPFAPAALFAEFERAMIRERVMTGLARARADGKQLGRRTVEQSHRAKGLSCVEVALTRCGHSADSARGRPWGRDGDQAGRQ
jgi:hypothetical protein